MIRRIFSLVVFSVLLISSCAPATIISPTAAPSFTPPPAPTDTATPEPSPTPVPTPTETAEQKMERFLNEQYAAGARANDRATWPAEYQTLADNATRISKADHIRLKNWMVGLREREIADYLATEDGASMYAEFAHAFSLEGKTFENLTALLRQFLEVFYKIRIGAETAFAPLEDIGMLLNRDAVFPYYENVSEKAEIIGSGWYGWWAGWGENALHQGDFRWDDLTYSVSLYGQPESEVKGVASKTIRADYGGYQQQFGQEGIYKIYFLLRNARGTAFLYPMEVATDGHPITIPVGAQVLGAFGSPNSPGRYQGTTQKELQGVTYYSDGVARKDTLKVITPGVLQSMLAWPPSNMEINTGGVLMNTPDGYRAVGKQFFDPETGLTVVFTEQGSQRIAGWITFWQLKSGYNPWP